MKSICSPGFCGVGDGDGPSDPGKTSSLGLGPGVSARRFARRSERPDGVVVWYRGAKFWPAVSSNADLWEEDKFPGEDWNWDIVGGILGV